MALTKIDDRGLKTPVDLLDNEKIRFGTGNDLEIYHASNVDKIESSGNGMHIRQIADGDIHIHAGANDGASNNRIVARSAGAAELYYDGSLQTKTTSTGLHLADDKRIDFGTSSDLRIYHDGSNSYIADVGTGELRIRGTTVRITDHDGSENFANFNDDGGVELFYDNSKKFHTHNTGGTISGYLHFDDGAGTASGLGIGNSDDLQIYHDGSNSYLKNTTGDFRIDASGPLMLRSDDVRIYNAAGNEFIFHGKADGSTDLYYDNSKKFETVSGGAKVTGTLETTDTISTVGNIDMADSTSTGNNRIRLGTGDDLEIFHDGTNSNINNSTGTLKLGCSNNIEINTFDGHAAAKFINDGAVELYHNNAKKFETTSDGAKVDGYFLCERSAGKALQVHMNSTDAVEGSIFRHNRGGLSGYSGKMISFKGNDNTEEGDITINVDTVSYNTSSDYRLKDNEVLISDGITRLKILKPYRFNFKRDPSKTVDGFFAHEVTPAVPEAITGEKDAVDQNGEIMRQSIDHSKLVPLLTAALQEAITKIETLETKVAALEAA